MNANMTKFKAILFLLWIAIFTLGVCGLTVYEHFCSKSSVVELHVLNNGCEDDCCTLNHEDNQQECCNCNKTNESCEIKNNPTSLASDCCSVNFSVLKIWQPFYKTEKLRQDKQIAFIEYPSDIFIKLHISFDLESITYISPSPPPLTQPDFLCRFIL